MLFIGLNLKLVAGKRNSLSRVEKRNGGKSKPEILFRGCGEAIDDCLSCLWYRSQMAVEACDAQKLMDDIDGDDVPLSFKRSSSSRKQSQSTLEAKKSLPSKPDRQPVQDVRSQNGQGAMEKSKMAPSSKSPPVKSPLSSPKSYNSTAKGSEVKSSEVKFKPSTLAMDESNSRQIKDEKPSTETIEDSEDSDDDKPLNARVSANLSKVNSSHAKKVLHASSSSQQLKIPKPKDSDDEMPLSSRFQVKSNAGISIRGSPNSCEGKPSMSKYEQNGSASIERKPLANLKKRPGDAGKAANESRLKKPKFSDTSAHKSRETPVKAEMREEDDEDHVPISHRMKKLTSADKKASSVKKMTKPLATISKKTNTKQKKSTKNSKLFMVPPGSGGGQKWTTLVHNGVIFPPPYKPHGVKMLYKGKPVDLTPEQEEVATMYAVTLDTDYMNKPQVKENFMADWRKILGKNHVIKSLEHCDFTPIYEWHQKEKEKKKQMTMLWRIDLVLVVSSFLWQFFKYDMTTEKKALREEKQKQEDKYTWAIVDGMKEKVGNFRVEPPGLFRGRGDHPKIGKLKKRILPSDITINIGKDAPIPECPIPGESWKEIRHDNMVTWLAYWNDPINPKESKYVFLAASSKLKGQSDREKYEKARRLKDYIHGIRATYTKNFTSKDSAQRQIAVATYLIDKLALRAGNEKDNDEANTVGCCTLKVEHVEPVPPNILKFDFLGKDSIRYDKEVEVETLVFKAIQQFRSGKKGSDDLFDGLDTSKLNAHLKELMPGLTAKVFRTYNASITLDDLKWEKLKRVAGEPAPSANAGQDFSGLSQRLLYSFPYVSTLSWSNSLVPKVVLPKTHATLIKLAKLSGGDNLVAIRFNHHVQVAGAMVRQTRRGRRSRGCCTCVENVKLSKMTKGGDVAQKAAVYQDANKEVAIICNHQRAEPKNHDSQMLKLNEKIDEAKAVLKELQTDLTRAKKGKPPMKSADGKTKRNLNPDALERKIAQSKAKIGKLKVHMKEKEDMKNVALGTSKINYNDPRITVAWCKRHEVPIEKIFTKTILEKFVWAMDVDPEFRF
ncbi:topoisomerase I [Striga asiatica]|uniref:DNA topoisomerase n=1 Tax=Striga asiatica TaxID=4170 RepID=A0A5A7R223_STRAF|nr:topoisomerase I [Striga asiatica]